MACPNTRNWVAIENRQPQVGEPMGVPFHVTGEVETTNGAIQPVLRPAVPQGFNPYILILELTLERMSAIGTTDVAFRDARYDARISKGQYSHVQIRCGAEEVAFMEVQVVS